MEFHECPQCHTRVLPMGNGKCPNCNGVVDAQAAEHSAAVEARIAAVAAAAKQPPVEQKTEAVPLTVDAGTVPPSRFKGAINHGLTWAAIGFVYTLIRNGKAWSDPMQNKEDLVAIHLFTVILFFVICFLWRWFRPKTG